MASALTLQGDLRRHLVAIYPASDLILPSLPPVPKHQPNLREALERADVLDCLCIGRDNPQHRARLRNALYRYRVPGTLFARFELERRDGVTELWLIRVR